MTGDNRPPPIIREHEGIFVARDDLYPGGTKSRFLRVLFAGDVREVVYATPAQGGAQIGLAHVANMTGKQCTLFVARRNQLHPRTQEAKAMGAKVVQVDGGYLNVIQARARSYAQSVGATLAPFGVNMPEALECISDDARAADITPDEVWCAAGSGTLCRALARAFPNARRHVVQVGHHLTPEEAAGATIHVYPRPYDWTPVHSLCPFPADPHYEVKAWTVCKALHGPGKVLFWNVVGPSPGQPGWKPQEAA